MIYWVISEKGKEKSYLTKYLDHIRIFRQYHRFNVLGMIHSNYDQQGKWVTKEELIDLLSL